MKLGIFATTVLTSCFFIATSAQAANPNHIRQLLQTKECRYCDLLRANLSLANLRGADLRGSDLYSTDLKYSDLREAILTGANLYKSDLRGADLTGAEITGTDFREANMCNAIMPDGTKSKQGCPDALNTTPSK
ncbi:pentapeptide repeat-containing protein [Tumidithrix elongata RA019]|uniref:Pentapeptide repeat-containing protein n=1 Tax=Tumidithrix elongata BACA0141 TaxID=2716417 RepID=A0AAW9PYD4_9CYAN|nr:pentapeptide repeat-containing protein [Tumidithrix elongata RA019]